MIKSTFEMKNKCRTDNSNTHGMYNGRAVHSTHAKIYPPPLAYVSKNAERSIENVLDIYCK